MDTHSEHSISPTGSLVQDPVCGMDVDPATSEHHLERDGHDYYFCSAGCRATFEAQPDAYLNGPEGHAGSGHDHGGTVTTTQGTRTLAIRTVSTPLAQRWPQETSRSGRARCTRRSGGPAPAPAPSAAWPSSRSP